MIYINANELLDLLVKSGIHSSIGKINMTLNGTTVQIKENDIIGNALQEWLGEWLNDNNIYYRKPIGQVFPDFYLNTTQTSGLCEMKAYVSKRTPAFDIANFDSYWNSLRENPLRLDSDYIIFAYSSDNGNIKIDTIYLKKVWQITGPSNDYPLKCQRKNGQIYNIRPCAFASKRAKLKPFSCKEEFLAGLYKTVLSHTNQAKVTNSWLKEVLLRYKEATGYDLNNRLKDFL